MGTIDEEERKRKIRRDIAKEGIRIENEYYMLLDDEIKKINDERNKPSKKPLKKVIETTLNSPTGYDVGFVSTGDIYLDEDDGWKKGQKVRVTIESIEGD